MPSPFGQGLLALSLLRFRWFRRCHRHAPSALGATTTLANRHRALRVDALARMHLIILRPRQAPAWWLSVNFDRSWIACPVWAFPSALCKWDRQEPVGRGARMTASLCRTDAFSPWTPSDTRHIDGMFRGRPVASDLLPPVCWRDAGFRHGSGKTWGVLGVPDISPGWPISSSHEHVAARPHGDQLRVPQPVSCPEGNL